MDRWAASTYREGAVFAQTQFGQTLFGQTLFGQTLFGQTQMDKTPSRTCYGRNNLNLGDFTLGCDVARQRLAQVAAKPQSSAEYATRWNAPVQPVDTSASVEQEYQSVYFCGRQVTHLLLKIFRRLTDSPRRGLFVFGPNDNGLGPRGSFMVEGVTNLNGRKIMLTPSKWVLQPPGYSWFGLTGNSDDGGKTFSGHLTDSSTCTRFTLARVRNTTVGK